MGGTYSTYRLSNVHTDQFLLLKPNDLTCAHLILNIHKMVKRIVHVFVWGKW